MGWVVLKSDQKLVLGVSYAMDGDSDLGVQEFVHGVCEHDLVEVVVAARGILVLLSVGPAEVACSNVEVCVSQVRLEVDRHF